MEKNAQPFDRVLFELNNSVCFKPFWWEFLEKFSKHIHECLTDKKDSHTRWIDWLKFVAMGFFVSVFSCDSIEKSATALVWKLGEKREWWTVKRTEIDFRLVVAGRKKNIKENERVRVRCGLKSNADKSSDTLSNISLDSDSV